jgi:hypothetical protein
MDPAAELRHQVEKYRLTFLIKRARRSGVVRFMS